MLRRLSWNSKTSDGKENIHKLQKMLDAGMSSKEIAIALFGADPDNAEEIEITIRNLWNIKGRLRKKGFLPPKTDVSAARKKAALTYKSRKGNPDADIGTRIKNLVEFEKPKHVGLFELADEELLFYRENPVNFAKDCVIWDGEPLIFDQNQIAWLMDKSRLRIANKSRRIGITFVNDFEAFHEALFYPHSVNLFVSTNENRAKEQLDTIYKFADNNPKLFKGIFVERPRLEAKITTGSKIYTLPCSPSGVRGIPQTGSIHVRLDEYAHYTGTLDEEMMSSMMGNLLLNEGRLSAWSTPFGKRGLFHRICQNIENEYPDYMRHVFNWRECPRILHKTMEMTKRNTHPVIYRQEYENEFVSTGEELFPIALIESRVRQKVLQDRAEGRNPYYFGIDFALGGGDNVGIIVAELMENKYILRRVEKFNTKSTRKLATHILSLKERYNPSMIYCDQTGMGNPLVRMLQEEYGLASSVEGVVFTNPIKDKYIMWLWGLFNDGRIDIPNYEEFKIQLNSLQTKETSRGLLSYEHIKGQHDDLVWAATLACFSEQKRWGGIDACDIGIDIEEDDSDFGGYSYS